jgi:hypothetical protein
MRELVSIKKITDLQPIPEADRIETATIDGGWKVVVKKQEFEIGDKCLYFEIDSILPTGDPRFSFLDKDAKNFEWGRGARLRTIKLKNQVSQGLVLPIKPFQYEIDSGKSLSEIIGVRKWEDTDTIPEEDDHVSKKNQGKFLKSIGYILPKSLRGHYFGWINRTFYQKSKGSFPSFLSKSDQNRVQNNSFIFNDEEKMNCVFEVTVKSDGSSMTVYSYGKELGVCSRNMCVWKQTKKGTIKTFIDRVFGFKSAELRDDSNFTRVAKETNIISAISKMKKNIGVQGELVGPKVNGNRAFLKNFEYHIYDIYDIDNKRYFGVNERKELIKELRANGYTGGTVHEVAISSLKDLGLTSVDACLKYAEGIRVPGNEHIVEGVVFKSLDGQFSFKAVSNEYLLKWKC